MDVCEPGGDEEALPGGGADRLFGSDAQGESDHVLHYPPQAAGAFAEQAAGFEYGHVTVAAAGSPSEHGVGDHGLATCWVPKSAQRL